MVQIIVAVIYFLSFLENIMVVSTRSNIFYIVLKIVAKDKVRPKIYFFTGCKNYFGVQPIFL